MTGVPDRLPPGLAQVSAEIDRWEVVDLAQRLVRASDRTSPGEETATVGVLEERASDKRPRPADHRGDARPSEPDRAAARRPDRKRPC